MYTETARFTDMRPPRVDSNAYSYHLKVLLREQLIVKKSDRYALSTKGLSYIDRVSTERFMLRDQPKVVTMLLVRDTVGRVLLMKRQKQPFINKWTLPYGKLHIDDISVVAAAKREAHEKLGLDDIDAVHISNCYIRVNTPESDALTSTLVHLFKVNADTVSDSHECLWTNVADLGSYALGPAVEQIVHDSMSAKPPSFSEYTVLWEL